MNQCPACGGAIQPGAVRCFKCGTALDVPPAPAPMAPPPVPQVVYAVPAVPMAGAPMPAVSDKSRLTYILLAWFLGVLGVHNFYAGRTGKGVAQLLITLLIGWTIIPLIAVGIWVIVEMITVTKDGLGRNFA